MIAGREPALFFSLFSGLLTLALAFGLDLTELQQAALTAAMFAIVGFLIRQNVTPLAGSPNRPV